VRRVVLRREVDRLKHAHEPFIDVVARLCSDRLVRRTTGIRQVHPCAKVGFEASSHWFAQHLASFIWFLGEQAFPTDDHRGCQ
jgi:hypothetical protein